MAVVKINTLGKILITTGLLAGSMYAANGTGANNSNLFGFTPLGTAGELRTELQLTNSSNMPGIELTCGAAHKKETGKEKSKPAKKEAKVKEAKCGAKHDSTKAESKAKESKCGQGKCGNK